MKFAVTARAPACDAFQFASAPITSERGGRLRVAVLPLQANSRTDSMARNPSQRTAARPARHWTCIDNVIWTPVVDDASRHLYEACKAMDDGDLTVAAFKMRSLAADLRAYAVAAAKEDVALGAADYRRAQNASWRMAAGALRAGLASSGLQSSAIRTKADLSAIVNPSILADIDWRWL